MNTDLLTERDLLSKLQLHMSTFKTLRILKSWRENSKKKLNKKQRKGRQCYLRNVVKSFQRVLLLVM